MVDDRCQAEWAGRRRCVLSAGHDGRHSTLPLQPVLTPEDLIGHIDAELAAEQHRQGLNYVAGEHCDACRDVDRAWAMALWREENPHLAVSSERLLWELAGIGHDGPASMRPLR